MEQQLIRCLKAFAAAIISGHRHGEDGEDIVDTFMKNAELALSPSGREELINHIQNLVNQ